MIEVKHQPVMVVQQEPRVNPPAINITLNVDEIKKCAPGQLAAIVNEIAGGPIAMPAYQETEDAFGTKLEWAAMPEVYDKGDQRYMDVHHVSGMSMLCMRMRWGPYGENRRDSFGAPTIPFDHLAVHKAREKVILFIVKNGEPITLEDQKELFPSDELVTKLRLLTQDDLPPRA